MSLSELHKELELAETLVWNGDAKPEDINRYEQLSREMEGIIATREHDERHHIMLVIPVADRPQHLETCLESIFNLCESFCYGGKARYYNKVSVLIAEDSSQQYCREKNKEISESFSQRGLQVTYFGLDEQKEALANLNTSKKITLEGIIGSDKRDCFYHKGASITRNITYLKLMQLQNNFNKVLFYFIDSDQKFKVNKITDNGEVVFYSINYFYHLDKIFTDNDIEVLTGKVVGDPPVSPSVMAANFLDDVCFFMAKLADFKLKDSCKFHGNRTKNEMSDAAYHDMADLFGFKLKADLFEYCCDIKGKHNNTDCLERFSSKLNQFFDGVHLTRKTYYQHKSIANSVVDARTIYTGNFAFTKQALRYFIPFAGLKLRMAGPTMGRLIKENMGDKFVSVNLPMLHERTVEKTGQSEFRPGIQHNENNISLQGEFERQYFGDVMLFSVEELIKSGYPGKTLSNECIKSTVLDKEVFLRENYFKKFKRIQENIKILKSIYKNNIRYENNIIQSSTVGYNIESFIHNMEVNFSIQSVSYQLVTQDNSGSSQIKDIIDGIINYMKEMTAWSELLEQ